MSALLHRLLPAALGALLALPASAAGETPAVPDCPASVQVTQNLQGTPDGWQSANDAGYGPAPHSLSGIALYSGHPDELAALVPDEQRRRGKTQTAVWWLSPSPHGYWVRCSYRFTTLGLVRPLPAGLSRCEVRSGDTSLPALRCR